MKESFTALHPPNVEHSPNVPARYFYERASLSIFASCLSVPERLSKRGLKNDVASSFLASGHHGYVIVQVTVTGENNPLAKKMKHK